MVRGKKSKGEKITKAVASLRSARQKVMKMDKTLAQKVCRWRKGIRECLPPERRLEGDKYPALAISTAEAHNRKFMQAAGMIVVIILFIIPFFTPLGEMFSNPQGLKALLLSFGHLSWAGLVLLQFLQVVISVIPGQFISIAGSYVFGFWIGLLLNLTGVMLGSVFVFKLARRHGKRLVLTFVDPEELIHLNAFFEERGLMALGMARVVPFFPNDAVSFVAGLTKIPTWKFFLVTLIGFVPQFVLLAIFGGRLGEGMFDTFTLSIAIALTLLGMFYFFRGTLKRVLLKEIRELEQDFTKLEREIRKLFSRSPDDSPKPRNSTG
ncbi:MAG: TVP38/TMEM64 family protein [archaeon]